MRGYDVKSLLLAPIFDDEESVVGLVELVNKEIADEYSGGGEQDTPPAAAGGVQLAADGSAAQPLKRRSSSVELKRRNSEYGFSKDDEKLLRMLCAHCSIFLKHLETD